MKAIIVIGSRDENGQTASAARALAGGFESKGGETQLLFLPGLKIERCRQCDAKGWGTCRSEARCVIQDDFASVVDKLRSADVAVFATPVYFGDLSESMRAFLDRLRRTSVRDKEKSGIAGKPAVGICVAGGGGGGAPSCAVSLERVLNTCGFDLVDMVPARRQNLELKLRALKLTGEWLAAPRPV
jgi:multimeric flavodoxin WrbA